MTTKSRQITEAMLERLSPPKTGRVTYRDTVVRGLRLRVSARGTMAWLLMYKVYGEGGTSRRTGRPLTGRQHRHTLGRYPEMGLSEARSEATEWLNAARAGRDLQTERIRERSEAQENTVEAVAGRFVRAVGRDVSKASRRKIERTLELHVLPHLGDRPIAGVRLRDVVSILDGLVAQERVGAAREVRKHLNHLFGWAAKRELMASNPLGGEKFRELRPNRRAGRALTDAELRLAWAASAEGRMGYPFGPFYRLLILTGARRSEWSAARRPWIVDRCLEIPADSQKSDRDHLIPLADPAWAVVEALPRWNRGDYLFSTKSGARPISGFTQGARRLRQLMLDGLREADPEAELAHFRAHHDFRVTCETRLASLGFDRETRDAVLGHKKKGLQETYNKHDYLREKRAALAAYAEHLMEVVGC